MKVVILHPPLYPVNHKFFNELGKKVDLVVFSFGNFPGHHSSWKVKDFVSENNNYTLKIIEGNTNLKRLAVSYRLQLNPSILKRIHHEKPDILISIAFWMPSFYAAIAKIWMKYKLMIITDATKKTESKIKGFKLILRKFISRKTDAFIAASNLTKNYLESEYPYVPVYNSLQTIDLNSWQSKLSELDSKQDLRSEFNIPDDTNVLLSVGNFIERKNYKSIIDQLPYLENVILLLIGGGELEDTLKAQSQKLKVAEKVRFIPRQEGDMLKKYFKLSDIFIFPTKEDAFGYVAMEAFASGLPLICSKHAGVSTLVTEGENGHIIEPDDYYHKQIDDTLSNLKAMSTNAITSIKKYTLDNKVQEFCAIFNSRTHLSETLINY
ncbi:MAG: glycosyltransferase family 4 protein [bacterium]